MKDIISVKTYPFYFVLQILIANIGSYTFKCPQPIHWKFRAVARCNSTLKYVCLYNNVKKYYIEECDGPDWDRKGSKRIHSGSFTRGNCTRDRFQPFRFFTNEMSDCIYAKSICSEEGQVIFQNDSTRDDTTCRCDHTRNYSFVKTPKHFCFCIPAEEDCSCYIKSCLENLRLSPDYDCSYKAVKCTDNKHYLNGTFDEKLLDNKSSTQLNFSGSTSLETSVNSITATILIGVFVLVAVCFIVTIKFCYVTSDQLHARKRNQTAYQMKSTNTVSGIRTISFDNSPSELTVEEINLLRLVHLLFRVACPVIRMIFNKEIQPNQLRKTLDDNKLAIRKQFRKTGERAINDFQWNLMFGQLGGKTVTSEDFEIRLMILLFREIAKIEIGDEYPEKSVTSVDAMLSRIKYLRNEAARRFGGISSEDQFNQNWDDIGQAVLKLLTSNELDIEADAEKIRLLGRLLNLNPIYINRKRLCRFIDLSECHPSMILQQLISDYCKINKTTIEDILRIKKHELYHKRVVTESCCECPSESPIYSKTIYEKQWKLLFEMNEGNDSHICPKNLRNCSERFVPKQVNTGDLSVSKVLILSIPNILIYVVSRLYGDDFDKLLVQNKHRLYHSTKKKKCCKCNEISTEITEKSFINEQEFNTLFTKDNVSCQTSFENCCCQYSVTIAIDYSRMDDALLSKLFCNIGPISLLNRIEKDAFLYFLNWTLDDQPLEKELTELFNMKEETQLHRNKVYQSNKNTSTQMYISRWISKHMGQQKPKPEQQQLHMLVQDEDGLNVKCVQIPKGFPLPKRSRTITDITPEENCFLVVYQALTETVNKVIKIDFDKKCPENILNKIRMDFQNQNQGDCNESQRKRFYLTQNEQKQLFAPQKGEPRNLSLKLMIKILKHITDEEGNTEYVAQLDVICNIQREIVQSSSGVLTESRFQDLMQCIRKAVLVVGGESCMLSEHQLVNLQNMKNILESGQKVNAINI